MESILDSIKKMLGIEAEYHHFDQELIIFINSVFGICYQLGIGSGNGPIVISSENDLWTDFIQEAQIEEVKTYIWAKVKLLFDPPTSSFALTALQDLAKEFEWRSNITAESISNS